MKIAINNDLLDISARLREIKPSYGIVFNTENQKFEVTDEGKTVLVLPYENLDERTLERVFETRCENVFEIIKRVDKENEALEKERMKRAMDRLEDNFSRETRLLGI